MSCITSVDGIGDGKRILRIKGIIFFCFQLQQMYQTEGMLNERHKVQFENSIIKQLSLKVPLTSAYTS